MVLVVQHPTIGKAWIIDGACRGCGEEDVNVFDVGDGNTCWASGLQHRSKVGEVPCVSKT